MGRKVDVHYHESVSCEERCRRSFRESMAEPRFLSRSRAGVRRVPPAQRARGRRPYALFLPYSVAEQSRLRSMTKSEEFRAAHARAGNDATGPLYLEHPKFEGFEVRQTVTRKAAVA